MRCKDSKISIIHKLLGHKNAHFVRKSHKSTIPVIQILVHSLNNLKYKITCGKILPRCKNTKNFATSKENTKKNEIITPSHPFRNQHKILQLFALLRHEIISCLYSVAYPLPRRNNSMKKLRYFLARAENRRTFASVKRFMH